MGRASGILVIDHDSVALKGLLELLRNAGFTATGATSFESGRRLLDAIPFDVLVVDVHLHERSGMTLVRMVREAHPAMAVLVLTAAPDPDEQDDAQRLGADYLQKPLDAERLLALVAEKVSSASRQRRWPRKRIAGGFGASVENAPGKVVDMSYGGFRFQMAAPPESQPPASIQLKLLPFGLSIAAELVWTNTAGDWTCGAAVSETDWDVARAWRIVVDALPEPN
jgi:DNA-binding response OmpR family regulator